MGFVATPELGHQAVELGVNALARLSHRGGLDADGKSGDGAGLLIQVPHRLLGDVAVASLFEWDERAKDVVAESVAAGGMQLVGWRKVPIDPEALGALANLYERVGQWAELNKEDAIGKQPVSISGNRDCQASLPAARGSGERQQPLVRARTGL